jgi:xanthine dehydrogenase YagT iron-sulfur-binding subunit
MMDEIQIDLNVNGKPQRLSLDPRVTLLDTLRETLGLYGTKKGCDQGQCGACTVLIDGVSAYACLTLAVMHDGAEITTIEGLGTAEQLHPLQRAFVTHDAFQCGYCTPGQIMAAAGLIEELRAGQQSHASGALDQIALNDAELRERMSGNLCRCAAYPNILAAVKAVLADASV